MAALKLGCLFSLKGDNAEPYGTNKTPLTAGDISRGAVVRIGFSFHLRREECNSSQSSDNNVNVCGFHNNVEVNRRHDVDAFIQFKPAINMARELLECKQAILPAPQVPSRRSGLV